MKLTRITGWVIPAFFLSACGSQPNLQDLTNDLADVECQAIQLREQRFQLANTIRFTQDSLLKSGSDSLTWVKKLQQLDAEKQMLLAKSLQLADTITRKTNAALGNLSDKEKQQAFSAMLDEALKKRGCK